MQNGEAEAVASVQQAALALDVIQAFISQQGELYRCYLDQKAKHSSLCDESVIAISAALRADIERFIENIPAMLESLVRAGRPVSPVTVEDTIKHDRLICLEDGREMRVLTRHLRTHGLTPEEYRKKWGLPSDYPMACPAAREQWSKRATQTHSKVTKEK